MPGPGTWVWGLLAFPGTAGPGGAAGRPNSTQTEVHVEQGPRGPASPFRFSPSPRGAHRPPARPPDGPQAAALPWWTALVCHLVPRRMNACMPETPRGEGPRSLSPPSPDITVTGEPCSPPRHMINHHQEHGQVRSHSESSWHSLKLTMVLGTPAPGPSSASKMSSGPLDTPREAGRCPDAQAAPLPARQLPDAPETAPQLQLL